MDVARTQSCLHFFSLDGKANKMLSNILFVFAKMNPYLSYIQGMNEILAPIVYTFGNDPNLEWSVHTEADAFFCFSTVMKSMHVLYKKIPSEENNEEEVMGIHTQMKRLDRLLGQHDIELRSHLVG